MNYKAIEGPVIPIPTPFDGNQEVDLSSLGNYTRFLSESGLPAVMTTVGTSRYNLLSWDEIRKVNETLVNNCVGDCISIVANPPAGGLKHAIEFGKHAESIGADFYLVFFPERHYGEENTLSFFKALDTELNIPMLIHEMPMRNGVGPGQVQYSLELLDSLLKLDSVVGMKEEALDADHSNLIVERFHDKGIIIGAGGGMSRYLYRDFDRGAKAFLGGLGNFNPQIEMDFYKAITSGNKSEAKRIVEEIELKYFEGVVPIGWHPSLKSALAIKGHYQVYERSPMIQPNENQVETVRQLLSKFSL